MRRLSTLTQALDRYSRRAWPSELLHRSVRAGGPVYSNLAAAMAPIEINRHSVAEINYILREWEFVYLAAVLDEFSRRVID
jgi:hypothetical protein